MPNFTVKRRRRNKAPPQPEVEPVEPEESKESDEIEVDVTSEDERYIEAAIHDLKQTQITPNPPHNTPQTEYYYSQPQSYENTDPHYENQTTVATPEQYIPPSLPTPAPQRRINDPYRRKPTMERPNRGARSGRGGGRLRYRSHYGLEGEHLDTQTKSYLLYTHCFG